MLKIAVAAVAIGMSVLIASWPAATTSYGGQPTRQPALSPDQLTRAAGTLPVQKFKDRTFVFSGD